MNHFAGKAVIGAQSNLMKARDERISLMNEVCQIILFLACFDAKIIQILGGIRMLKVLF